MRWTYALGLALFLTGMPGASVAAPAAPAAQKSRAILPFIHDDYAAALRKAREARLPLFIESWAPW